LNANKAAVEQAIVGLRRIYSALWQAKKVLDQTEEIGEHPDFQKKIAQADQEIADALNDDFNTPRTFAAIFEVVRAFNGVCEEKKKSPIKAGAAKIFMDWVKAQGQLMALFQETPTDFLNRLNGILLEEKGLSSDQILALIKARGIAREEKNYQRSDEIRDKLLVMGVEIQDGVEGTEWQVKL
jgi:cysteinyl-tRNA synthetase